MSLIAAIVGLALLVLIHEAGHFFAARAVGMTPRKFYLGFGPPLVKRMRGGVEYGIGAFPLGGYVKIPGMNRPSPGDLRASLRPDAQNELRPELARLDNALERGDEDGARAALEEMRPEIGETRMWQEQEMALAPDAYWRQATWRRLVAIFAGPAVNLVFAIVLFTCLFLIATTRDTNVIGAVQTGSPAAAAHIQKGDRILTVSGEALKPKDIPAHIRATNGKPFALVVDRKGHRVTIGPLRARITDGAYRIGVAIEQRTGAGESLPAAVRDSFKLTWGVTSDTVRGLGHLAAGRDTNQVSSTVGIVKVSSAAWRQGARDFLFVLGLISLALGLLNLIPVLPLDGGHILIALVEKLRGRTFAQAVYIRYSLVGLSLFAILMYFGLRNDLFGGGG
ncbi:MAG TPA: M50 family metallopeptidase [Casimicrobiaceae bacterium]|nr:M50 family metallopeptidase [Casimicrobiaceae bacterium]